MRNTDLEKNPAHWQGLIDEADYQMSKLMRAYYALDEHDPCRDRLSHYIEEVHRDKCRFKANYNNAISSA